MRAVVQRVSSAKVSVGEAATGEIGKGLLVLLGVTHKDDEKDAEYLADKIIKLRIFDDADGKMKLSLADIDGGLLVVSQFTLYGDTRKGNRPSFIDAAPGKDARPLYESFVGMARRSVSKVETGKFGAMMEVELVNDGPVTIILDSEKTI